MRRVLLPTLHDEFTKCFPLGLRSMCYSHCPCLAMSDYLHGRYTNQTLQSELSEAIVASQALPAADTQLLPGSPCAAYPAPSPENYMESEPKYDHQINDWPLLATLDLC